MKTLTLIIILLSSALISNGEELRLAVCSIRYAVQNHPEILELKNSMKEHPSEVSSALLRKKETSLRMMAIDIIKELATSKGYELVLESSQTRKDQNKGSFLLINYSGDDISEVVANILAKRKAEQ